MRDPGLGMGLDVAASLQMEEPLSPELALVCPELAERARRLLPEPGWLVTAGRCQSRARTGWIQSLVLALFSVAVTVTPLVFCALMIKSHTLRH